MDAQMRRWRESVARGMRELSKPSLRPAAEQLAGRNVEIALSLGEFVSSYAGTLSRAPERAPIAYLRERRR